MNGERDIKLLIQQIFKNIFYTYFKYVKIINEDDEIYDIMMPFWNIIRFWYLKYHIFGLVCFNVCSHRALSSAVSQTDARLSHVFSIFSFHWALGRPFAPMAKICPLSCILSSPVCLYLFGWFGQTIWAPNILLSSYYQWVILLEQLKKHFF